MTSRRARESRTRAEERHGSGADPATRDVLEDDRRKSPGTGNKARPGATCNEHIQVGISDGQRIYIGIDGQGAIAIDSAFEVEFIVRRDIQQPVIQRSIVDCTDRNSRTGGCRHRPANSERCSGH